MALYRLVLMLLVVLPILIGNPARSDAGLARGLKPDVRLLIDTSGSMKESDPENLRAPSVDLMVRLLPEGSRAGIWIFGEEVRALVPHGPVDDDWRQEARRAVSAIDNSGQRTNIPAALAAATFDLKRLNPAFRTSVVLLTDGKVDVAESPMTNAAASRKLLAELAPELGAIGVPVHTIALSDEADWVFLQSLAQASAGIAEKAESASKLTEVFLQSLEMVAPTARVPVTGRRFTIDDSVKEFTALVFHEREQSPVGLIAPSGDRHLPQQRTEGISWFSAQQFALVTVVNPSPGDWRLEAPEGSVFRVTVISELSLDVDPPPNNLPAGKRSELGLRLLEKGRVISDPEVLGLFDLSLEISAAWGESQVIDITDSQPVPADGEFRVGIPPFEEPGRYQLTVRVEGETLRRELPMIVEVSATPRKSTLVTRGEDLPEDDFRKPLTGFAGVVATIAVLVWLILRRRKRRKLEVWHRRSRSRQADADEELVQGVTAEQDSDEGNK